MKSQFPDHMDLLCRKGFYPYAWVDDISKFRLCRTSTQGGVVYLLEWSYAKQVDLSLLQLNQDTQRA